MNSDRRIIILAGLPLVGKTTVGKELARKTNLVFLDVDDARSELEGNWKNAGFRGSEENEKNAMLDAYKRNHKKAVKLLKSGSSVILAATYSRPIYHEMLKNLAKELDASLIFFLLSVSDDEIKNRIRERVKGGGNSNIHTKEDYLAVENRYKVMDGIKVVTIDSTGDIESIVDKIFSYLPE